MAVNHLVAGSSPAPGANFLFIDYFLATSATRRVPQIIKRDFSKVEFQVRW